MRMKKYLCGQESERKSGGEDQPVGVNRTFFWLQLKAFSVLSQSLLVLAFLYKVIPFLLQTGKTDFSSSF